MLETDSVVGVQEEASASPDRTRLSGGMRTGGLMMSVLALSAPVCVAAGFIPLVISTAGESAPVVFVLTALIMALFAIGYIAMTRSIPKPGAFYTFISAGLRKPMGLGSSYLAIVSYALISTGSSAFFGLQAQYFVASFGGPEIAWPVYALIVWAVTVFLGHFNIDLSAKVLGVVMVIEIILVMTFNIAVIVQGGEAGLPVAPLNPLGVFEGNLPVALVFAILVFIGFEATALYRDEVKDSGKTIPRATFGSVAMIGFLYALTAYALLAAYGPLALQQAADAPASMFSEAIGVWVLPIFTQIVLGMVIISQFAALLSFQNVLARYVHSLSADGALPRALSAVHPKHKSPYRASAVVGAFLLIILLAMTISGLPGESLYAQMTGLGAFGVIILMLLVSVSVVAYFRGRASRFDGRWKTVVAPVLASVALGFLVIYALSQFEIIVGGEPGQNIWMPLGLAAIVLIGAAVALYYRSKRPDTYARLGRSQLDITTPLELPRI